MITNRESSIVTLEPESPEEASWLRDNVEAESWQWLGAVLAVDFRMAGDVIEAALAAGFEVL